MSLSGYRKLAEIMRRWHGAAKRSQLPVRDKQQQSKKLICTLYALTVRFVSLSWYLSIVCLSVCLSLTYHC